MKSKIKITIVDDHELFREGLNFVLSQIEDFEIINEASTGRQFLDIIRSDLPDIVLMDVSMPEMDGIQATELALQNYPDLKIIALTSYTDDIYYYKMIRAGVQGFIIKSAGKDELQKAILSVYNGNNYFPQNLLRKIIMKISNSGEESLFNKEIRLSKREKEILLLICQGYSNNEIGEKLFISPKTVDNHRTNLLHKTSTKNSANLVMFSIKNKLIEI
jgi:DNA-binding NarL/FixJ family response regulator